MFLKRLWPGHYKYRMLSRWHWYTYEFRYLLRPNLLLYGNCSFVMRKVEAESTEWIRNSEWVKIWKNLNENLEENKTTCMNTCTIPPFVFHKYWKTIVILHATDLFNKWRLFRGNEALMLFYSIIICFQLTWWHFFSFYISIKKAT